MDLRFDSGPLLLGGDASKRRASFSRFVLPFRWRLSGEVEVSGDHRHFRPARMTDWLHGVAENAVPGPPYFDRERARYLTHETRTLLFTNTRWFILEDRRNVSSEVWRRISYPVKAGASRCDRTISISLRHPAMVLFECPAEFTSAAGSRKEILQTGFLIHEAYFSRQTPDEGDASGAQDDLVHWHEVLRFNEIFRHWRSPYPAYDDEDCKTELEAIAKGLSEKSAERASAAEAFSSAWVDLLSLPVRVGAESGTAFLMTASQQANQDSNAERDTHRPAARGPGSKAAAAVKSAFERGPDCPDWLVSPDDRAFTVTCAVACSAPNGKAAELDEALQHALVAPFAHRRDKRPPVRAGYWVKLLNVDRPHSPDALGTASDFEIDWARERTYKRWAHTGTLYGFCEHAFAALIPASFDPSRPLGDPPSSRHVGAMYFDSTLLLFYLRLTAQRFSEELHFVTRKLCEDGSGLMEPRGWRRRFRDLREQFIVFENLYQYPQFSNQQQHLEMYEIQRRFLDVSLLYEEVDKEVRASDDFLDSELETRQTELSLQLNVVAAVGLVIGLALAWMETDSGTQSGTTDFVLLVAIFALLVLLSLVYANNLSALVSNVAQGSSRKKLWTTVSIVALTLALGWTLQHTGTQQVLDRCVNREGQVHEPAASEGGPGSAARGGDAPRCEAPLAEQPEATQHDSQ